MGAGSSPLTRGKLHIRSLAGAMARLIPAHAGKTSSCQRRSLSGRAHPRSRRENRTVTLYARGDLGSSPLTRGKRAVICAASCSRGLIPAHAGKTSIRSLRSTIFRAHPRSRVENRMICRSAAARRGSSPLTRGKLRHEQRLPARDRLIPAHAGKTRSSSSSTSTRRAHPRVGGENEAPFTWNASFPGSSPRRRGKLLEAVLREVPERLIPA